MGRQSSRPRELKMKASKSQLKRIKSEEIIKNLIIADGGAVNSVNVLGDFVFVRGPEISTPQIKRFFETGKAKGMFENLEFSYDEEIAEFKMSASLI